MRKVSAILVAGALLAVTPTVAWAREYKEDGYTVTINDILVNQYDNQIVQGLQSYGKDVHVTRIVVFADGAVEAKLNWDGGSDKVVIAKDGCILSDRFMVDVSEEVDSVYTQFIVEGLTQWAIAHAPMGGVTLQSVSEDATTCEVKVNEEVIELDISSEEDASDTTVHVVNWFEFEQEPVADWQINALKGMAEYMYDNAMKLGAVQVTSIQQHGIHAKTTGLDICYTGDSWTALETEQKKINVPLIGRN